ncbi:MAG: sugar phosphate isomerase/epimerase [Ruminococcaceae bacterium]|nr:sugar phosphate isomerase/epimerase [Oscillospiraceae bacterium]
MKIATTIGEMYNFSSSSNFASSSAEAVSYYKDTGFHCLDFSFYAACDNKNSPLEADNWKDLIFESKAMADKLGFSFVQAHAPSCELRGEGMERELLITNRAIEACEILGIKNMVMHPGRFPEISYNGGEEAYCKENEPFFKALIPAMEKHNVNILFENGTLVYSPNGCYYPVLAKDLNAIIDYMDHPLFGAAWDVGHAHMESLDHYTQIMELGKNLKAIHVHDNDGSGDWHDSPFFGSVDYDSLMRGLIESGFEGTFTLEADSFFSYDRRGRSGRLGRTPLPVKQAALSLLYVAAKTILTEYDLYEE